MSSSVFGPMVTNWETGKHMSPTSYTADNINSIMEREDNYIFTTFRFLTSLNEDFNNANKIFYRSVLESSGDVISIQEAYGDFFEKFKDIINKFLKFIKSLVDKFISKLMSIVQSEKYVLSRKKDLEEFSDADAFEYDGYNYSFDPEIPMIHIDPDLEFSDAIMDHIRKNMDTSAISQHEMSKKGYIDPAKKAITNAHDVLRKELDEGYYDKFRGTVIGTGMMIPETDFVEECFAVYRNNQKEPTRISIDKRYVTEALKNIQNYKATISAVERAKKDIDTKYNKLRVELEGMLRPNRTAVSADLRTVPVNRYGDTVTMTAEALSSLDAYLKDMSNKISEIGNIHGIAFSSKLQAIREQYMQDKKVLYTILSA